MRQIYSEIPKKQETEMTAPTAADISQAVAVSIQQMLPIKQEQADKLADALQDILQNGYEQNAEETDEQ